MPRGGGSNPSSSTLNTTSQSADDKGMELSTCQRPGCSNPARRKYCSNSCAARVNNNIPKKAKAVKLCASCNERLANNQRKYCSPECQWQGGSGREIEAWLLGSSGSDSRGELRSVFRQHLLREAGHSCTACGWSVPNPMTGKVILTVDHIDGNWQNNKRDNLRILCYNCHTLTPTFGALNRNKPARRPGGARAVQM